MAARSKRSRVATAESDSEAEVESPPSPKRARTSDESDVEAQPAHVEPHTEQQHIKPSDFDDNDDDLQPEIPNEDEEKRFEEEHEPQLLERVSAAKAQGNIAEMGIIEKLELCQFMCHKFLDFNFGPQINFIIGHNGSGKSAVLSALTVALGGKANVTGRGSGLKSFIREGQSAAEVSVTIKNQGEDAFKHKDYGDSIVITRKFTKEGSSSYKIKGKHGKTVSTKRDELSAICDHMNIQVDNPMNILTQDSARQFLSASAPADKYKFFLRGTQLSQLSEEYSTCLENISQTQRILKTKAEILPDLHIALDEATNRYHEAEKARKTQQKVDDLKKELAWAHVAGKEQEFRAKVEEVAKAESRLPRLQEKVQKAENDLREAEELVEQREDAHAQLGGMEDLNQQREEVKSKMRENKEKIAAHNEDKKQAAQMIKSLQRQIDNMSAEIAQEKKKQEEDTLGKREELEQQYEAVVAELAAAEERHSALQTESQQVREAGVQAQNEQEAVKRAGEQLKGEITGAQEQLRHLAERERSKLAPFGSNMEAVLADIAHAQWHGNAPVGPLGRYVKVRDPQRWANIMRVQLGHSMGAFAITDARDRKALEGILRNRGNRSPNIIIAPVDIFDYSGGEPPENFLTVLRALEISDEYVLRVLINSNSIERILLAPSRAEGDQVLLNLGGGGTAWTADSYNVTRFPEGGGRSSLLPQLNRNSADPRLQLFTTDDLGAQKQRWQEQLQEAESTYQAKGEEARALQQVINSSKSRWRELDTQIKSAQQAIRQLKSKRDKLQDEMNQAMPVEIQALQGALNELEDDKAMQVAQFTEFAQKIAALNEAQHPLMGELDAIKERIHEFEDRREAAQKLVAEAVEMRLKAQTAKAHYEKKLAEEEKQVADLREAADILEQEFTSWTAKAEKFCKRVANPRDAEEVKRSLESVQKALQTAQKKNPVSVDELAKLVTTRRAALEKAESELKQMLSLNKSLRKSIKTRLTRWHEFRRHIALRCKIYFSYHLSQRGYFGKVIFDHVAGLLQLKVQTDDQTATQAADKEKDPRSLSGGEKSFSTICLLLSLWESIGCPIRCLDEFDVFMDAVNRRISMKMMIDTANASDRKQYILITPQDMNNVHIGPSVRVHRMTDPERGQGVLAFQGS